MIFKERLWRSDALEKTEFCWYNCLKIFFCELFIHHPPSAGLILDIVCSTRRRYFLWQFSHFKNFKFPCCLRRGSCSNFPTKLWKSTLFIHNASIGSLFIICPAQPHPVAGKVFLLALVFYLACWVFLSPKIEDMQEILWLFVILCGIKTYIESESTQARRKKIDPITCKTLTKNQQWIHVNVPVMSLQRFYGFRILWELKTDKGRHSKKLLIGPSSGKKNQTWCFLHFLKNVIIEFFWKQKLKIMLLLKSGTNLMTSKLQVLELRTKMVLSNQITRSFIV